MKNKIIIIISTILVLTSIVIVIVLSLNDKDISTDSYTAGLDDIDMIISDMVIDEDTQTITSGLYKYEFSSLIPENYKDIIKQLHEEVGYSYQTYFIYDEKDGKIFVLLDSCEEYYMTIK